MTHRERVLSRIARTGYDRLPVRYHAVPPVHEALMHQLGLTDPDAVEAVLGTVATDLVTD
jgi:hypothetical protein